MAFNNVSTSVSQAVNFLTRPLSLVHPPATVNALQAVLRSTISAAAASQPTNRKLVMTFTTTTPARPVFAACIAVGINWAEWMELLGNREFDLFLEPSSLVVRYDGLEDHLPPRVMVVWTAPQFTQAKRSLLAKLSVPQVPISKFSQKSAMKQRPVQAPLIITPPSPPFTGRTLAQQLLDSDREEEADELLAMINPSAIISPTPTREQFSVPSYSQTQIRLPFASSSFSPISSPEPISPASSRPSSRSSLFSNFSDDESLSSATSVSSSLARSQRLPATKPTHPRAAIPRHEASEPQVFVDNSKKNATKYLYQGGVSSTLGGGVMLGRPTASAAPKVAPSPVPKYRAPIGGKKTGANAPSWRRPANATPRF